MTFDKIKLAKKIQDFMGLEYATMVDIIRKIADYTKENNLCKDIKGGFIPDDTLSGLLGTSQEVKYSSLQKFIVPHFVKIEKTFNVKAMNGDITRYAFETLDTLDTIGTSAIENQLSSLIFEDLNRDREDEEKIVKDRIKLVKNEQADSEIHYFLCIRENLDYPFTSWGTFFEAYTVTMQTEFGVENAPIYTEMLEDQGGIVDFQIMEELLEKGNDPQEGLKGLVQSCLDGCRYSYETIPSLGKIIDKMIKKGAVINKEILSMMTTPMYSEHKDFEGDMDKLIKAKGYLLNMLFEFDGVKSMFLEMIPNWDEVIPIYYENMIVWGVGEYKCHTFLKQKYEYLEAYYSALKKEMNEAEEDE